MKKRESIIVTPRLGKSHYLFSEPWGRGVVLEVPFDTFADIERDFELVNINTCVAVSAFLSRTDFLDKVPLASRRDRIVELLKSVGSESLGFSLMMTTLEFSHDLIKTWEEHQGAYKKERIVKLIDELL